MIKPDSYDAPSVDVVTGQLLQVRYRHPGSDWCLGQATLEESTGPDRITVVGSLETIPLRKPQIFYGTWQTHPKYGRQFHVKAARSPEPVSRSGIVRYLSTAKCPHLGPKTAEKLEAAFGADTLTVLRTEPERVAAIPGIRLERAQQWQQFLVAQQGADHIIVWLLQWDIDPSVSRRLYAQYGAEAIDRVRSNPYALTTDTWGVGFATVDRMALSMGWGRLSPERMDAVWRFGIETALTQGDCYQTTDQLMDRACTLLDDQSPSVVRTTLTALLDRFRQLPDCVVTDDCWQLRWVARAEEQLGRRIRNHPAVTSAIASVDWPWLEARTQVAYAPEQRQAIEQALTHPFSIVTGGPGTGKTTILNGLLTWLIEHEQQASDSIVLAAPTARAAQRMQAVTGHEARTIHRLLESSERRFLRNAENPVKTDWLITDEVSMLDLSLANALWQAIHPSTRVVWIGDEHQLPSVGPGSVLKDVMTGAAVPVTRLTHNFRSTSGITVAAHTLLANRVPTSNSEVTIVDHPKGTDKLGVQEELVALVADLHAQGTSWDDIQVLTPIRRGPLGTEALNTRLRDLMNPVLPGAPMWVAQGGRSFRIGDRVMQTKNAYSLNVFNGDQGVVVDIAPDPLEEEPTPALWVEFPEQQVRFTTEEARNLVLAYATTVHKAQGSEYPVVIVPVCYDAYVMLYRNLVYTAMTRARERLWIFTEGSALWLALKRGDGGQRQTRLAEVLRHPA